MVAHAGGLEWFKRSQWGARGVLRGWDHNCLFEAVEAERRGRNNAAVALLGSQLAADWPRWDG